VAVGVDEAEGVAVVNRPGVSGESFRWKDLVMGRPSKYPTELRERAVRMVLESRADYGSEYEAIRSIAAKLGITSPESLRKWLRRAEVDGGARPGKTSEEIAEIRELKKENAELRRANEILKSASAFFAAELDRPHRY
jgi:transposase